MSLEVPTNHHVTTNKSKINMSSTWCDDRYLRIDDPTERRHAERRWVLNYLSAYHTSMLCDTDIAVPKPPDWMLFWYDDTFDAS